MQWLADPATQQGVAMRGDWYVFMLVATAVGLFVAIPAVLAFNIFQRLLKRVIGRSNALGNAIASGLLAKGK